VILKCVDPGESGLFCVSLGASSKISDLRFPPSQLLLMSRIQSGDGAARTDAEDEEHEPFSHGSPLLPWLAPSRALLDAPVPPLPI
jgi:hypothetical protein